jgi:hypothetical protein
MPDRLPGDHTGLNRIRIRFRTRLDAAAAMGAALRVNGRGSSMEIDRKVACGALQTDNGRRRTKIDHGMVHHRLQAEFRPIRASRKDLAEPAAVRAELAIQQCEEPAMSRRALHKKHGASGLNQVECRG